MMTRAFIFSGAILSGALVLVACSSGRALSPEPLAAPPTTSTVSAAPAAAPEPAASDTPASSPIASAEPSTAAAPEPAPEPAPAPEPEPVELPKGTVVLHVGDSMADALGKDLKVELRKLGIDNVLKYKEATYIPQWASRNDMMGYRALIAQHDPDLVIISLGGNEVAMPDPSIRAEPIRRMVEAVGDRPCLWIAAPLWPGAPHTGIQDVIRENCAPCVFVDTTALLQPSLELYDGIHPTIPERKRWAKFMIEWLRENLDPTAEKPWTFR